MGNAIEHCQTCETRVMCHMERRCMALSPVAGSGSAPDLTPLQRSHNYLTYQMGVIAHRLEHGDSPESVGAFALKARDYAEAIVSNPKICIPNS